MRLRILLFGDGPEFALERAKLLAQPGLVLNQHVETCHCVLKVASDPIDLFLCRHCFPRCRHRSLPLRARSHAGAFAILTLVTTASPRGSFGLPLLR